MCKKYGFIIIFTFILTIFASTAYGVPSTDIGLYVWPYWQIDSVWTDMPYDHGGTIGSKGCALTSLSMLLRYYGLEWIPDNAHEPIAGAKANPLNLNLWMMDNNGYDSTGNVQWLSMKNFYYYNWPYWYFYQYIRPDYSCVPTSSKNNCFSVDWSTQAETLLDYDLLSGKPDIMKIEYFKYVKYEDKCIGWRNHFVVISGYDTEYSSYRDNDPAKYYNFIPPHGLAYFYPPIPECGISTPAYKLRGIRRYEGVITNIYPGVGYLYFYNLSPVEFQIINPDGLVTGFDPTTAETIQDIPYANYFEESIDSLDPDAPPSEPYKVLMIDTPSSGNYIIRVIGISEGPYTIMMSGKSDNGANILDSPIITGTAYPGMVETSRIQYSSSTGQAIISTSNQPPIANAGIDQTVKKGTTVTLDGSSSYDPDGDPLKYSWTFVSKPSGSITTLSNPDTKTPSFTPDLAGEYTLQLIVNDFFIDSSPDTVTITVFSNQPPVADAGADQTVFLYTSPVWFYFNGSGSYDPDGDLIIYKWVLLEKPMGSEAVLLYPNIPYPSLLIDILGNYTAQLIVNDGVIDSIPDTVIVSALQPIDISIKAFRAPSRMVLGDTKEVTVVVKNLSLIDASFTVTVEDMTESKIVGSASGVEGAGGGGTRVQIPYTPATPGTHTLKATVTVTNPLSGDPNNGDNTLTDTTLVVER